MVGSRVHGWWIMEWRSPDWSWLEIEVPISRFKACFLLDMIASISAHIITIFTIRHCAATSNSIHSFPDGRLKDQNLSSLALTPRKYDVGKGFTCGRRMRKIGITLQIHSWEWSAGAGSARGVGSTVGSTSSPTGPKTWVKIKWIELGSTCGVLTWL